jgi:hypothetical protein
MCKFLALALALVALALTGGVAAISTMTAKPAVAAQCSNPNGC